MQNPCQHNFLASKTLCFMAQHMLTDDAHMQLPRCNGAAQDKSASPLVGFHTPAAPTWWRQPRLSASKTGYMREPSAPTLVARSDGSIAMSLPSEDVVTLISIYSNASAKARRAAPKSAAGDRITTAVCSSEMLTPCTSNDDAGRRCAVIRKCLYLA